MGDPMDTKYRAVAFGLGDDDDGAPLIGWQAGRHTWNGWDVVSVTPAVRDALAAICEEAGDDYTAEDLMSIPSYLAVVNGAELTLLCLEGLETRVISEIISPWHGGRPLGRCATCWAILMGAALGVGLHYDSPLWFNPAIHAPLAEPFPAFFATIGGAR